MLALVRVPGPRRSALLAARPDCPTLEAAVLWGIRLNEVYFGMTEPICGFDLGSEITSGSDSQAGGSCVERPVCGPSVANESFCLVMPTRTEVEVEQAIPGPASSARDHADLSVTSIAPTSIPGLAPRTRTVDQNVAAATSGPAQANPAQVAEVGTTRRGPTRPASFPAAQASPAPTTQPAPQAQPVVEPKVNTIPVRARREGQGPVDQAERHREALRLAREKALLQQQAKREQERPLAEPAPAQPVTAAPGVKPADAVTHAPRPKWELTGLEPVQDSILEIDGERWAWENGRSCSIGN